AGAGVTTALHELLPPAPLPDFVSSRRPPPLAELDGGIYRRCRPALDPGCCEAVSRQFPSSPHPGRLDHLRYGRAATDRGSLLGCHGLVMTCGGAGGKLAVRLTRSPLATRPEQPPAVKMCKFPPLVFTRWVRSLAVNFPLPSKAPPPVPSITKPHPAPAAL